MTTIYIQKMKVPKFDYEKIYNEMNLQAPTLVDFSTSYYGLTTLQRDFVNELIDGCIPTVIKAVDSYNEVYEDYEEEVYVTVRIKKE